MSLLVTRHASMQAGRMKASTDRGPEAQRGEDRQHRAIAFLFGIPITQSALVASIMLFSSLQFRPRLKIRQTTAEHAVGQR
jgi:hypothetical protein